MYYSTRLDLFSTFLIMCSIHIPKLTITKRFDVNVRASDKNNKVFNEK
jgi:hypothetical protein